MSTIYSSYFDQGEVVTHFCEFQISVEILVYCNVVFAVMGRLPVSLSGGADLPLVPVVSYVTVLPQDNIHCH